MIDVLISLFAIFIVVVISEFLWRRGKLSDEVTRKVVHIFVAIFVAFWPYYMSYKQIQLVALAFLIVIAASRYLHIFKGILHVKRKTFGDFFFPLSIFILATIAPVDLVFAIALLNIGLADGVAALIGEKYGKKNKYKIFNQTKSVAGSLTFIAVSFSILLSAKLLNPDLDIGLTWLSIIILPPLLSIVENVSVYGADDLTVPLVLLVGLKLF